MIILANQMAVIVKMSKTYDPITLQYIALDYHMYRYGKQTFQLVKPEPQADIHYLRESRADTTVTLQPMRVVHL